MIANLLEERVRTSRGRACPASAHRRRLAALCPLPRGELELAVRQANTAALPALMDVVAIILGLVSFVILLAFIEGLERV